MENKINIAELLEDAPKGTELYSPAFGRVYLDGVRYSNPNAESEHSFNAYDDYAIKVHCHNDICTTARFDVYGRLTRCEDSKCMLFPKENITWENFKAPWKHKHFEPYQKVLVAKSDGFGPRHWYAALYSHFDEIHNMTNLSTYADKYVIPYEGNEDKLGKEVE